MTQAKPIDLTLDDDEVVYGRMTQAKPIDLTLDDDEVVYGRNAKRTKINNNQRTPSVELQEDLDQFYEFMKHAETSLSDYEKVVMPVVQDYVPGLVRRLFLANSGKEAAELLRRYVGDLRNNDCYEMYLDLVHTRLEDQNSQRLLKEWLRTLRRDYFNAGDNEDSVSSDDSLSLDDPADDSEEGSLSLS